MLARLHAAERSDPDSNRRFFVKLLVAAAAGAIAVAAWSSGVVGQTSAMLPGRVTMSPLNPARPQTYEEVLVFGLQAKLPSELAFIDSVVDAVEVGDLPARLVDQTYFWARTRSGSSMFGRGSRPIIYFIPALQARINRLRLDVDLEGGLP